VHGNKFLLVFDRHFVPALSCLTHDLSDLDLSGWFVLRQILTYIIAISANSSFWSILLIFTGSLWFLKSMSVLGISASSLVWHHEVTLLVSLGHLVVMSNLVFIS
jgi:hypothetical protein